MQVKTAIYMYMYLCGFWINNLIYTKMVVYILYTRISYVILPLLK